ncbi:hypothetical protein DAPPUDRAFT_236055 [Daphnia pulex]|uniref:Uncharacterized protein n=1 Tax=Daphnia pulex TaxID=6669 RepID=E9FZU2_DAPPU|nr:hypothetical protein DAPPUDRAFT_236055 [Daphnia pulex]|eukprot:EFX87202.1 hypothetical protein DAPPUDRAFT_236055 [Daphnia pulex]
MVESNVLDLVSQAVSQGSIAELNQIRKNYNWIAIPIGYVTQPLLGQQQGETALQQSARNGHYDVVEFLVGELKYQIYPEWAKSIDKVPSNFTWTSLNFNKVLPPLVVQSPEMGVIRDIANQIPIVKVVEYLIDPASDDEPCQWLEFVLNSIVASSASRTDKIIAFELMGAAFVFKQRNVVWRGLQCWEQAMALRYSTVGDQSAIPITPDPAASSLFVDRKNKLIASPTSLQKFKSEWRLGYNLLEAQTQALAVSQRIVNQCVQQQQQQRTGIIPYSFHLEHLMRYAYRCYIHENQLNCSLNIAQVILRQTDEFHSTSSPNCIRIFVETLDLLVDCLKHKTSEEELSFANLLVVVQLGLAILMKVMLLSPVVRPAVDRWQFNVMDKIHRWILEHFGRCRNNPAEIQQLKDCLSPYFRANNLKKFTSLLHLAISSKGTDGRQILPVIQLFLEAGADPTGIDTNGQTPLHLLSENQDWFQSDPESYEQVFQALLDAGCCLDQSIPAGKTFLSILNGQKSNKCVSKFRFHHYLDPLVNVVLPLACVCAKVIRHNRIAFEGRLPPRLQSFVSRHSAMEGERYCI